MILPELSADSVGLEASPGASSLDLEPQETRDSIMTVARSVARAFFRDISFSSLKNNEYVFLPGTRCQDAFMTASCVFLSSRTATTMIAPFTMDW